MAVKRPKHVANYNPVVIKHLDLYKLCINVTNYNRKETCLKVHYPAPGNYTWVHALYTSLTLCTSIQLYIRG